ncbi:acyl-CoA dehydrogenase family protein [Nocardioides sp. TF02-7]|uniref:acyl-CoA dehydrogenase family protein n=1 Tax=Nocardioides sp. TF02-7 TaxID=2917724 RepID=UPI001F06B52D|nr:acyl-CoA dehydrogenase family protein [Nocardioides sp. TF02-7]UMG92351.1 acyl-CoA/acyl-ACP dehydrogenase [Nocardioides sp. TF02-7]
MEFALSEEQAELAATVRAVLAKQADSAAVRAAAASDRGYDDRLWATLCDQVGVAALAVPEEHGGAGATFFETAVVLEELGRSLAPAPLLATVVAAEALLAGGTEEARQRLLPRIAAGQVATIVLDAGRPVLDAAGAEVVLTVTGDDLVEVERPRTEPVGTMDQTLRMARVDLAGARTTVVGDGTVARARAELVGSAAVAAMAVGLCDRALRMTVDHSRQRVQFGRAIGSFQALKHRMADLLAELEIARSASWAASYALATGAPDAEQLVHTAAAYALEAAAHHAAECVQLHGGIAITWEHDAQLVLKRAHALGRLFGPPHRHRAAVAL